ncbi:hypothetical protein B566_EDAN005552 [Ephemera danica]|nr:hypothetical protein B566_EDAN005552 [Ephemera danica]
MLVPSVSPPAPPEPHQDPSPRPSPPIHPPGPPLFVPGSSPSTISAPSSLYEPAPQSPTLTTSPHISLPPSPAVAEEVADVLQEVILHEDSGPEAVAPELRRSQRSTRNPSPQYYFPCKSRAARKRATRGARQDASVAEAIELEEQQLVEVPIQDTNILHLDQEAGQQDEAVDVIPEAAAEDDILEMVPEIPTQSPTRELAEPRQRRRSPRLARRVSSSSSPLGFLTNTLQTPQPGSQGNFSPIPGPSGTQTRGQFGNSDDQGLRHGQKRKSTSSSSDYQEPRAKKSSKTVERRSESHSSCPRGTQRSDDSSPVTVVDTHKHVSPPLYVSNEFRPLDFVTVDCDSGQSVLGLVVDNSVCSFYPKRQVGHVSILFLNRYGVYTIKQQFVHQLQTKPVPCPSYVYNELRVRTELLVHGLDSNIRIVPAKLIDDAINFSKVIDDKIWEARSNLIVTQLYGPLPDL